jgi:phospholipase/carboxylesterase
MSVRSVEINLLISEIQQQYNIKSENTFLIGFSQGAMLALYAALSDKNISGGVFMLSGIVAAEKQLSQKISAFPHVYMFHGENDMKVQYKTLAFSDNWLTRHNIPHDIFTYPELAHKMCEAEIVKICDIINKKTADGS